MWVNVGVTGGVWSASFVMNGSEFGKPYQSLCDFFQSDLIVSRQRLVFEHARSVHFISCGGHFSKPISRST